MNCGETQTFSENTDLILIIYICFKEKNYNIEIIVEFSSKAIHYDSFFQIFTFYYFQIFTFYYFQESKRSFLHSVVNEGGDKEKLESFVNFCEDTIFEVT